MQLHAFTNIFLSSICIAALTLMQPVTLAAQPSANATAVAGAAPVDPGWPRSFEKDGARVVLHQPQIDEWTNFSTVKLRSVFRLFENPQSVGVYGIIEMVAKTRVDKEERIVLLTDPQVQVRFPEASKEEASRMEAVIRGFFQGRTSLEVSLDRVLAHFDELHLSQERGAVGAEPPPIYYSATPAALLIFMGEPRFKPIQGTSLLFAVNTNWDVFRDPATSLFYIRNESQWLSTKDLKSGPYEAARTLPDEFAKIPKDENWEDLHAAMPPQAGSSTPRLFVSTVPAELIVTEGEPEYSPIGSTALMYIANTDLPILFDPAAKVNYLLVAGRWFSAPSLEGPWRSASGSLPGSFSTIPPESPVGFVRASVPGTDEAEEAVLLASVPDKATINRSEAKIEVVYDGEPKFKPVESTPIQYAVNTTSSVFAVDGKYYCCYQGVWFEASSPKGPWQVCTSVPGVIYSIPVTHPTHNVTYVYVYESTPETVTVGSTSGYQGEYIVGGLLVFGAGMLVGAALEDDDDDWYAYGYHSHHYSYGCGAIYHGSSGGYYRSARAYGPYGGAGAAAAYNPATGAWARGGYAYGPSGAAFARGGYNPSTNTGFAQAGRSSPYGSWSRGVAVRDDEWARGGTASNSRGSAGWVETSKGSGAIHVDSNRGGQATLAKDQDGDVYVGKDGNIYKRDDDGSWSQRENGNWENADQQTRTTPNSQSTRTTAQPGQTSRSTTQTTQPSRTSGQTRATSSQDLESQRQAREKGNARSSNFSRERSAGTSRSPSGRGGRR